MVVRYILRFPLGSQEETLHLPLVERLAWAARSHGLPWLRASLAVNLTLIAERKNLGRSVFLDNA